MGKGIEYADDIEIILSHRQDNNADFWETPDHNLFKGAPFSMLDCVTFLLELGMSKDDPILKECAQIILATWKEDGRFKGIPKGGIYPCSTAVILKTLCYLGYEKDERVQKSFQYFIDTQELDGGWKCNKYSFGRGPETEYSTPITVLEALDAFRFTEYVNKEVFLDKAVQFLLEHWVIRKPISPCHYGIGKLFKQVEYPFRGYNLFYYLYVLSFYDHAKKDKRFLEALELLKSKTVNDQIIVERVVPKLAKLDFCKKGEPSKLATKRYQEILDNIR